MSDTLRAALGQCLCVGFDGLEIPDEYIRLVKEYKVGNVLLFRRNVGSYAQLKKLCADLKALIREETGHEPFIMIDEECGRVSRLAHIAAMTPSAMAIGATGDPEDAYRIGRLLGEELSAAGINFNLAPVLDCYLDEANAVDGNRTFASDPDRVAACGNAYIRGMRDAGIMTCGKHFPGSGDTAVDSHLALPIVEKSLEAMRDVDLKPFRAAIEGGVDAIMSAHIVFPQVDPERVPSTVSRRVMTGLLREEMGFDGIIISDGMEMHAVMDLYGVEEGIRRALEAGVDIALVCHSPAQAENTCEYVMKAVTEGRLAAETVMAHARRIAAVKERLRPSAGGEEVFGSPAQKAEAERIMDKSIRLLQGEIPALDADTVYFGVPVTRTSLAHDDEEPLDAAKCLAEAFGGRYVKEAPAEAKTAVVCLAGHPDLEAVKAEAVRLAENGTRMLAVSFFTPYCFEGLPEGVARLAAWQYDPLAVGSVIRYLRRKG